MERTLTSIALALGSLQLARVQAAIGAGMDEATPNPSVEDACRTLKHPGRGRPGLSLSLTGQPGGWVDRSQPKSRPPLPALRRPQCGIAEAFPFSSPFLGCNIGLRHTLWNGFWFPVTMRTR